MRSLVQCLLAACLLWDETRAFSIRGTSLRHPGSSASFQLASSSSSSIQDKKEADVLHAREVFDLIDADQSNAIQPSELQSLLQLLDISADQEEAQALFRYLDVNDEGKVSFEDFLPWYSQAMEASQDQAAQFQALLQSRRTVDQFDQTPISQDVLERAIACAITAPNRSQSEPWRFIAVGPQTVAKIAALRQSLQATGESSFASWTKIPGWCVVTCKLNQNDSSSNKRTPDLEDYKSVACAIQNFMLSMWSEGIGSKWTSGPIQQRPEFAQLVGVNPDTEAVVGVIWYGFAKGGLQAATPKQRSKKVQDVLTTLE